MYKYKKKTLEKKRFSEEERKGVSKWKRGEMFGRISPSPNNNYVI
jgi:hypothetical protein